MPVAAAYPSALVQDADRTYSDGSQAASTAKGQDKTDNFHFVYLCSGCGAGPGHTAAHGHSVW